MVVPIHGRLYLRYLYSIAVVCCPWHGFVASSACGEDPSWSAPPLARCISIRDGQTDREATLEDLIASLSNGDIVFLGESHDDETTHRLQLEIYEALLERKQNKVVLALEMFERDVQQTLDRYLAGEIDEGTFLRESRPWENYREAYRPLIEAAKRAEAPVIASNFPTSLRRKFAMEGKDALTEISEAERRLVPEKFLANSPSYWRRVDNAVRGHQGMAIPNEQEDARLFSTQSLWDNAMGEACADALDQNPGHLILHINGGFHSAYHDGAVRQLRLRKPSAKVKTVEIQPVLSPASARQTGKPIADFVVFVEARATNLHQGKRSVQIGRSLEYLLHLPDGSSHDGRVPLLIWLPDRGLTAQESLEYCKTLCGDQATIAVLEPLYKETGTDLMVGGRWYWPETFAEDSLATVGGVEEIWAYLVRHFDVIDPENVCVAGEGTGATLATVIATHTHRLPHKAIAIRPAHFAQVKDLPLLLPELYKKDSLPSRSLTVFVEDDNQSWWEAEVAQYRKVGIDGNVELSNEDPWNRQRQEDGHLLKALGLEESPTQLNEQRQYLLVDHDSPRAQFWGRLQATWHSQAKGISTVAVRQVPWYPQAKALSTRIAPADVAEPGVLPRCPGPFGGTTVLLLPPTVSDEESAEWRKLQANDPLAAESRFHRLRIATSGGPRTLLEVLKELLSENRKNILIVPVEFFAELDWLHAQQSSVRELQNEMTIQWLPGLGGRQGVLK